MDLKSDIYGEKFMSTPSRSHKIKFNEEEIISLVKEVDRVKPANYATKVLEAQTIIKAIGAIDLTRLRKKDEPVEYKKKTQNPYTKTEIVNFAKQLGITDIQKKTKDELVDRIREIVEQMKED